MLFRLSLLLVPLSLAMRYGWHAPAPCLFAAGALAIVPLAEAVRRATEQASRAAGTAVAGLLNVTFGNLPELVIALFVLRAGAVDVVKAQITGSIIGNSLLGLGLAIVAGTIGREKQTFKKERASLLSSMLILCVIALLLPALFRYTESGALAAAEVSARATHLSEGVSIVLILLYVANLTYVLVTHRNIFGFDEPEEEPAWSLPLALGVLALATALVAVEAEMISDSLMPTATGLGLSPIFLGVVVLAVIGNAAEYISAVYFARRDRMGLVMVITVGSTIQVALLTAPVLVLISPFVGAPMDLVFANPLEMAAIAAVAFAVNAISQDGETTWFEGVLLLGVYVLLAMAFFFVT